MKTQDWYNIKINGVKDNQLQCEIELKHIPFSFMWKGIREKYIIPFYRYPDILFATIRVWFKANRSINEKSNNC
jgi:hypothetical protein